MILASCSSQPSQNVEILAGGWEYAYAESNILESFARYEDSASRNFFRWLRWQPLNPGALYQKESGNLYILKRSLPAYSQEKNFIYLPDFLSLRSIQIDNQKVADIGLPDRGLFRYRQNIQTIFELPQYEKDQFIYLIFQVRERLPSSSLEPPVIGSARSLHYILNKRDQEFSAIGFLFLIAGFSSLILYLIRKQEFALLSFAIFAIVTGVNLWLQTRLAKLLFIEVDLLGVYISLLMNFLSPIAFSFFFDSVITAGRSRVVSALKVIFSIFGVIGFPLALSGTVSLDGVLTAFFLTSLISTICFGSISAMVAYSTASYKRLPAILISASFTVYFLTFIYDLFCTFGIISDTDRFIPWASLFLLISVVYSVERKLNSESKKLKQVELELQSAEEIQKRILPSEIPSSERLEVAVLYQPMIHVAGDFYDYQSINNEIDIFIIADVSGHGAGAGIVAGISRFAFQISTEASKGPAEILGNINRLLFNKLSDQFISACCLWIDHGTGKCKIASAGHHPVLFQKKDSNEIVACKPTGKIIGFFEFQQFEEVSINLESGDRILMYTDGITEATDLDGMIFGFERLNTILKVNRHNRANSLIEAIKKEVTHHIKSAPIKDDMTMLAIDVQ